MRIHSRKQRKKRDKSLMSLQTKYLCSGSSSVCPDSETVAVKFNTTVSDGLGGPWAGTVSTFQPRGRTNLGIDNGAYTETRLAA